MKSSSKYWPHWRKPEEYEPATKGSARIDRYTADILDEVRALHGGFHVRVGDVATRLCTTTNFPLLWQIQMSDTYDEFHDHLAAIFSARGRVLVHGLGLGCYLHCILSKPQVTHIDVVEKNPDVIEVVSPYFKEYIDSGRLDIHQGDAFTFDWPKGTRWNYVWHDIWPSICHDHLAEHTTLLRSYGQRADSQGAWKHEWLKRNLGRR